MIIELGEFCKALLVDGGLAGQSAEVRVEGFANTVSLKVWSIAAGGAKRAPLIILFHGFVDQRKRTPPVFEGALIARQTAPHATVIAISDSALTAGTDVSVGWFLGTKDFDLKGALERVFDALCASLSPSKLVFAGGSTAAHPALVHGIRFPGSLCVLANPLARVSDHPHERVIQNYLTRCWPGMTKDAVFLNPPRIEDAGALYRAGHDNKVLILQNATDPYLPAVLSLMGKLKAQAGFMFLSEFFPKFIGHTYPGEPIAQWIAAAVKAPEVDFQSIGSEFAKLSAMGERSVSHLRANGGASPRDLEIASLIAGSVKDIPR